MEPLVTIEDLHLFHTVDRKIFSRLVIDLGRNPSESMLVMAFWLWLEDIDFPSITQKMGNFPHSMVNDLAREAARCLRILDPRTLPEAYRDDDMPLSSMVIERPISSSHFQTTKFSAITGVKTLLNKVVAIVFADILEQVLQSGRRRRPTNLPPPPLLIPGFPDPVFGRVEVVPLPPGSSVPEGGLWGWATSYETTVDDRTMFLTFSRGYWVTEEEVWELFTSLFGDCVEAVRMVPPVIQEEQSLYARMVVRSVETIDKILGKKNIAKLRIHGKHVWARKYERRDRDRDRD
ncbi:unnamed protein product [Cuscuta epithymum]|uniref:Uncharacterized protein n=1 Tax=Cuscuta epithymum TaxID=186058 RepID=A0AAV0CTC9_9ASTE|nr:unnamed protein product [Cuscuta epithymum]